MLRGAGGSQNEQLQSRVLLAHRRGARGQDIWAAIDGFWRLIRLEDGAFELYDHRTDPTEHDNVVALNETIVGRLGPPLDSLQEHLLSSSTPGEEVDVEVDNQLRRTLESLGYVQR